LSEVRFSGAARDALDLLARSWSAVAEEIGAAVAIVLRRASSHKDDAKEKKKRDTRER